MARVMCHKLRFRKTYDPPGVHLSISPYLGEIWIRASVEEGTVIPLGAPKNGKITVRFVMVVGARKLTKSEQATPSFPQGFWEGSTLFHG